MASSMFSEAVGNMNKVKGGDLCRYYVRFVPYAPKEVINAALVEVVTFPNCGASEDDMRAQVEKAKGLAGSTGVASGKAFGGHSNNDFVAIIGWDSIEASQGADKSYAAGSNVESHHVNFNFPIKGFRGL